MLTPKKSSMRRPARAEVSSTMVLASEWAWRFILVGVALAGLVFILAQLYFLVVPLLIAVLLAALASPLNLLLLKIKFPRWLATTTTVVVFLGAVAVLVWLVINELVRGWESVLARTQIAYGDLVVYLLDSPLEVTEEQLRGWFNELTGALDLDSAWLLSGALSLSSSFGSWLVGFGIVVFGLVFFIHDGSRIWAWIVRLMPRAARPAVYGATHAGWGTLLSFARIQVVVALINAVGVGLGALVLGLPLVAPIAVAVFLGSFVPFIGATVTGGFAVLVALVFDGPSTALIMLIIVVAVQQIEGQLIQPLIMGAAVRVHPLGVVVAITAGGYLAGIPGVLFAVPLVAFANVVVSYIAAGKWRTDPVAQEIMTARSTP